MTLSPWIFTAILLLTALVSAALGYTAAVARAAARRDNTSHTQQTQLSQSQADAAAWQSRAEELERRALSAEERAERDGAILQALTPVRTQLEQVGRRVEHMEKARAEQHATLSEQLRNTAATEQELRRTTSSLEGALRSRNTRGLWGEVELTRVLEASGMLPHVDFSTQRSIGSLLKQRGGTPLTTTAATPGLEESAGSARPDVVVHLPGDGHMALDAKVPLDSYLAATNLDTTAENFQAEYNSLLTAHAKALKSHVDALAKRHYDRALGNSPELVVLFIPAEPILSAALDADPTLMEYAMERGVALTTPTSLLALLRTCATAWARTAVNDDARELLALGRSLYERLGIVAGHLDDVGKALRRSVLAYNKAVGSMESRLLVTARTLENLGASTNSPTPISADDAQIRAFSAPELVPEIAPETQAPEN